MAESAKKVERPELLRFYLTELLAERQNCSRNEIAWKPVAHGVQTKVENFAITIYSNGKILVQPPDTDLCTLTEKVSKMSEPDLRRLCYKQFRIEELENEVELQKQIKELWETHKADVDELKRQIAVLNVEITTLRASDAELQKTNDTLVHEVTLSATRRKVYDECMPFFDEAIVAFSKKVQKACAAEIKKPAKTKEERKEEKDKNKVDNRSARVYTRVLLGTETHKHLFFEETEAVRRVLVDKFEKPLGLDYAPGDDTAAVRKLDDVFERVGELRTERNNCVHGDADKVLNEHPCVKLRELCTAFETYCVSLNGSGEFGFQERLGKIVEIAMLFCTLYASSHDVVQSFRKSLEPFVAYTEEDPDAMDMEGDPDATDMA